MFASVTRMIASEAEDVLNSEAAARAAPRERTMWIVGSKAASFAAADPIVEQVQLRYPRLYFVFTPRDAALSAWLRKEYKDSLVEDRLPATSSGCRRVVRRHNPRLVLLLDDITLFERALLRAARRRQIPIAVLATGIAADNIAAPELLDWIEHWIALDHDSLRVLTSRGVPPARITDATGEGAVPTAAAALISLLRRDLKALRSEHAVLRRLLERLAGATVEQPWSRRLARSRIQRIDTLEELADHLGRPQTILCLGNGPSSEDPRVRDIAHDALFRVNHVWQERGCLIDPDLVFTGTTDTVRRLRRATVAISLIRSEGRLLVAGLTRRTHPFRFVTLERLGVLVPDESWGEVVPTNGAFMLATAVALRPARLIVAGIDLFRHQEGAYPGDPRTPNAYTPRHGAKLDERVILAALDAYQGELVLISEVLAALWVDRRAAACPTNDAHAVVTAATGSYASTRRMAH